MSVGYILRLPMQDNDAAAETVGEYLAALLAELLLEEEGFSGKRPFGNSGWFSELLIPLVQGGVIDGGVDEDGYLDHADEDTATRLLIESLKKALTS